MPAAAVRQSAPRAPRPLAARILRWGAYLTAGTLGAVAATAGAVYAASEHRAHARVAVPEHAFAVPRADSATIARGRHVATIRACVTCHGAGLAGHVELDDPVVGRLAGPNLTRGGRGAVLADRDWERAVRHGVRCDGTPLFVMPANDHNGMSDEDLAAVVAYARSLPASPHVMPAPRAGPAFRALLVAGQLDGYPAEHLDHARPHPARVAAAPTAAYGRYLAQTCTGCHGPGMSGGPIPGAPPDWKPAANLTPAGIGHYTAPDFVRALRTGRRPGGAPIDTLMPWRLTRDMTDVELQALWAYLRTLPPRPYGTR